MDDPISIPLYAILVLSGLMYPLGLAWSSSSCCSECIRVPCLLDPRGFQAAAERTWHSAEDCQTCLHTGQTPYPVSTRSKCRPRCESQATDIWDYDVYYYGNGLRGQGCNDWLEGREPDWDGVLGCISADAVSQLAVQITATIVVDETGPDASDDLWPLKQASFEELAAALSSSIVFDLDCDGLGGCVQVGDPITLTDFQNIGGGLDITRIEKRTQAVVVATARVVMQNVNGVDSSYVVFDYRILGRQVYQKEFWITGEPVRITLDIEDADPPEQNVLPDHGGYGCVGVGVDGWYELGTVSFNGSLLTTTARPTHQITVSAPYGSGASFRAATPVGDAVVGTGGWDGTPGPLGGIEKLSGGRGYARVGRRCPEISATTVPGVSLAVTTEEVEGAETLPAWKVAAIAPTKVGTIYEGGATRVRFAYESGTAFDRNPCAMFPAATVSYKRCAPQVAVTVASSSGEDAELEAVIEEAPEPYWGQTWMISSVTVLNPGTGYAAGVGVYVTPGPGVKTAVPAKLTATVSETGEILSVQGAGAGGIQFLNMGRFYAWDVNAATITSPGAFYIEDDTLDALVADVTVTASPYEAGLNPGNAGAGFAASGVVDSSYSSDTFGEVMSLSVTSYGDGYMAWSREPDLENVSNDGCFGEPADCAAKDLGVDIHGDPFEASASLPAPLIFQDDVPATFSASLQ